MDTTFSNLFLVGPRGSGKTTVARLLAAALGWRAVDADVVLEAGAGAGVSIRSIFADHGEPAFRALESQVLEALCRDRRQVIATGGGVVLAAKNREALTSSGCVVWLRADAETLWERTQGDPTTKDRRPALTGLPGLQEIRETLQRREPLYRACATHVVDTAGRTPGEIADEIFARVRAQAASAEEPCLT